MREGKRTLCTVLTALAVIKIDIAMSRAYFINIIISTRLGFSMLIYSIHFCCAPKGRSLTSQTVNCFWNALEAYWKMRHIGKSPMNIFAM